MQVNAERLKQEQAALIFLQTKVSSIFYTKKRIFFCNREYVIEVWGLKFDNKELMMDQQYEDFKRQVKDSSDIVDVIASYI